MTRGEQQFAFPFAPTDVSNMRMLGQGMTVRAFLAAHMPPLDEKLTKDQVVTLAGEEFTGEFGSMEHWQFWAHADAVWRVMQADAILEILERSS